MIRISWLSCVFVLMIGGTSQSLYAAPEDEEGEAAPELKVEKEVTFPAYPAPASLLGFDAGAATGNRFLIDQSSIAIGEDAVVRFVLVVRTPGGVENVSFEGIRCGTLERRLYATGRSDHTWSKSRNQKWMAISDSTFSLPHMALAQRYLCEHNAAVRSPRQAIEAIRRGGHAGWLGS